MIDPGTLDGVDPFYLPESGNTFELPCFRVDRREVSMTGRPVPFFFVHPLAVPYYRRWLKGARPGPRFWATPSSSTRTLFVWGRGRPFFVKLSLPMQIAGEPRLILDASAIATSTALSRFRTGLTHLRETTAVLPRNGLGGFIIRELPRSPLTPWFALEDPERRIGPFLEAWMTSALEHGWVAEVHAQNLLFGAGRYWVRDMDGVYLDDPELEGARTSLHTYFLGGPARRHRRTFFRELEKYAGRAARDPEAFAQWLEDERHARRKAPRPPPAVRRWLQREQTQNPRRRDPRRFARVDLSALPRRFRPESQPVWRLPYFVAPLSRVRLYGTERPAALFTPRGVRFFFHPLMERHYALDVLEYGRGEETFWATPTASPRSVVVWNDAHLFALKLSLDVELLGINRLVENGKLRRAVATSNALRGVDFLREPVALRTGEKDYGFIYRELKAGMNALTPGFSVRELTDAHLRALVSGFAATAFGQRRVGDFHQQNVLFTRDGRLVLRDLDSFKQGRELQSAWADELRAEWLYLVPRSERRRVAERLDALIFEAARLHLGDQAADAERAHVLARWPRLYDVRDLSAPLYSLDAMVKASGR